jgi:4-amino-4-deoxy-L-arabinose transferase-like glycosyltransferase
MSSISASVTTGPRHRSGVPFWRASQHPGWVPPALLLILVCAGVLYCWGLNGGMYNTFYASAARSMSEGWKAFLFGSFSPANAITIDKIPGYLWPQAISARLLGFQAWSIALPQIIEAFVTVLVTYRLVRRWAGDVAAVLAAAFLALTPALVASTHTNNEEAAYVMCLALAASATQRAVTAGRLRSLAAAGAWVGLAFQCKMVEAWALLPVIAVTYLVAAPPELRRRILDTAVAVLVAVAVSVAWVVTVALVPASSRPYIDGTTNNNPFSMVFGYNALTRFSSLGITPASVGAVTQHGGGAAGATSASGLSTMFQAAQASQVGWLYPLAAVSIAVLLWQRRGKPRTDPIRAIVVMWTAWIAVYGLAYSEGSIHSYYVLTLAPALAALSGAGTVALWRAFRAGGRPALALPVTIVLSVGWGIYIASSFPTYRWLIPALAVAGIAALTALAVAWRTPAAAGRWALAAAAMAALAAAFGPVAWDSSVITAGNTVSLAMGTTGPTATTLSFGGGGGSAARGGFGPGGGLGRGSGSGGSSRPGGGLGAPSGFGAGSGSGAAGRPAGGGATAGAGNGLWAGNGTLTTAQHDLLDYVQQHRDGARFVLTTTNVYEATTYILRASADVLSVGGFTGQVPSPTLTQFEHYIASGQVRYVYLTTFGGLAGPSGQTSQASQTAESQIEAWVPGHCSKVPASDYSGTSTSSTSGTLYECTGS